MSDFLSRLKKASTNKFSYSLNEKNKFFIRDWISTGNYMVNTIISGDPFKGFPSGKVIQKM